MEVAYHLCGTYPDWWQGRRFDKPVKFAVCGVTSHQVKDVLQSELLGTANRNLTEAIGTGSIPLKNIDVDKMVKGRDGAVPECYIRHSSGGHSILKFFAYSQSYETMQGQTFDGVWVDEQSANNFDLIFSELVKRTSSVKGLTFASFTPLAGVTHVVRQFWDPEGYFHSGLVNAGWDDVEHLSEDVKANMLAATPPHLQDAVTKGIPVLGAGAVYNIGEQDIMYDGFEIPDDWPRICGVDVGFTTDPTAGIFVAQDPSTKKYYVYDEYGDVNNNVWHASQHVGHLIRKGCQEIPVIYDSAARARVGATGKAVTELWEEMGLNVLPHSFSNPKHLTKHHSASSYKSISVGLIRIYELMATGMLKVHSRACPNFWREFRSYSYDEKGNPSEKDNHWMDAFRYAIMSAEKELMETPGDPWIVQEDDDEYYYNTY